MGVDKNIVQRVWRRATSGPSRLARYMASNEPDFEAKAADIIDLYMGPPRHAGVFCRGDRYSDARPGWDGVWRLSPQVRIAEHPRMLGSSLTSPPCAIVQRHRSSQSGRSANASFSFFHIALPPVPSGALQQPCSNRRRGI